MAIIAEKATSQRYEDASESALLTSYIYLSVFSNYAESWKTTKFPIFLVPIKYSCKLILKGCVFIVLMNGSKNKGLSILGPFL